MAGWVEREERRGEERRGEERRGEERHRNTYNNTLFIQQVNGARDLVLWSKSCRRVFIVELTVPWEEAIGEAYERKRLRYANLAAEAEGRGWSVKVWPVEVGCRGFVSRTTTKLLKEMGIRGQAQRRVVKELAATAEQSSHWLWLKRRDILWAAK
ncbi:hypothetical protein D4764_01G0016450 [Takifugu flavidus]|uniref:Uncharacterized protein n=1 Tax=Takifugu flavidus TaxID=433684 RepID=A0A5C6PTQ7_9TELE|nr:hypothetical protein D4764_01G0016450 [Takifugu flavidus]